MCDPPLADGRRFSPPPAIRETWLSRSRRRAKALYGLPLAEFTAARNARAKKLKPDDPELAAAVSALPKPTVAAAALNALVHEDPSEVRALIQSGKRLRQAQEAAVTGKKGADLNEAVQEHRGALDRVQRDLRRRKLSGPTLEKAIKTLRVVSVDPELQPLLERGVLHEDLTASGFGLDPGLVPARPAAKKKPAPPPPKAKPKPDPKLRENLKAAKSALAEAEKRAAAALRDLERARKEADRAQQALDGGLIRAQTVRRTVETSPCAHHKLRKPASPSGFRIEPQGQGRSSASGSTGFRILSSFADMVANGVSASSVAICSAAPRTCMTMDEAAVMAAGDGPPISQLTTVSPIGNTEILVQAGLQSTGKRHSAVGCRGIELNRCTTGPWSRRP